jgi:putative copper resistance protein D
MVQHLVLTLVAAPLIALGAPITALLRVATPSVRRTVILPILHSRVLRVLSFPVVAWLVFAAVMWGTHFSPLFDRSLEDPLVHDLEHAIYLGAGLLFWWPAVGLDPSPWRMAHPVRAMYVLLQMPQNTFLALAILSSSVPLYAHYATLVRSWGPTALQDQQTAGSLMWICGDVLFIAAMAAVLAGWMRHEKRQEAAADRRFDADRAAIRVREARLAERLAEEREGP